MWCLSPYTPNLLPGVSSLDPGAHRNTHVTDSMTNQTRTLTFTSARSHNFLHLLRGYSLVVNDLVIRVLRAATLVVQPMLNQQKCGFLTCEVVVCSALNIEDVFRAFNMFNTNHNSNGLLNEYIKHDRYIPVAISFHRNHENNIPENTRN